MTVESTAGRYLRTKEAVDDPSAAQSSDQLIQMPIDNQILSAISTGSSFEGLVKFEAPTPNSNSTMQTNRIVWQFEPQMKRAMEAIISTGLAAVHAVPESSMTSAQYFQDPLATDWLGGARTENPLLQVDGEEVVGGTARWFNYVERRLIEFEGRAIAGNTDSGDYPAPPRETISAARNLAMTHFGFNTPTPSVVPLEEGGVEFIWHKGGWDIQISVGLEGKWVWARNHRNGETWHGSLEERSQEVSQLLDELTSLG